jgi:hypothetical protein
MASSHCAEEIELLKQLKEVQGILTTAINSLGGKTPPTAESRYLGNAAKSVNVAADAYILLREAARVDASKLLIRPMFDIVISATAVTKKQGFLFRKAYTELEEAKKMYEKNPANEAGAKAALEALKRNFSAKPGYRIECKRVDARYTAEVAGLLPVYETAYRLYCEFTHSAMRAVQGQLNEATDPVDTTMVVWCVLIILNHLKSHTPAKIPDVASLERNVLKAQEKMLRSQVGSAIKS